jgi:glycosyltransferase involved in cell wall biosynthesis
MRVLVAAYACNPNKGSEEGVGWGWVKALSKHHNLWVLSAEYHRSDIENAIKVDPNLFKHVNFIFVPQRPWHYKPTRAWIYIENSVLKPLMNLAYHLWQKDAYYLAAILHRQVGFELVHQLTYVGFRFPGKLWKLNVPFVWGPIGGLENTPWRFFPELGLKGCIYHTGKNIINTLQKRILSGPKFAFKKASGGGIVAATKSIEGEILRWYGEKSEVVCEIGPPPSIATNHSIRKPGEEVKLSWSGLHVPRKALPLLLKALSNLPSEVNWRLDIMGAGGCTKKWRHLAKTLDVEKRCKWYGHLTRKEALGKVHQSHLFIITSLKDLTSTVLLEALAQGVPVICPDHCGFSDVVTGDCGLKIGIQTPRQFVNDLAAAIEMLADNEEKRRRLAVGALRRIQDYSWEKKAKKINRIYERVVYKGV